jgi:hypothetical protein
VQWRVEEVCRDGDVRLEEAAGVRHDRPRELVHAYTQHQRQVECGYNSSEPWSCSASGAVAARSSDMRMTFPIVEKPYLDSERSATP